MNSSGAVAQVSGGLLDGLGAALYQQITLNEGKAQQSNFHDYPLLRITEAPDVEIEFLDTKRNPGGLGEVSYPAAAPAICNALFAAHGKRISRLPIGQQLG